MGENNALQLRITFDGTAPGLAEHRLSVTAFVEPLGRLVAAYRRIASGVLSDMLDAPEYGRGGGKVCRTSKNY